MVVTMPKWRCMVCSGEPHKRTPPKLEMYTPPAPFRPTSTLFSRPSAPLPQPSAPLPAPYKTRTNAKTRTRTRTYTRTMLINAATRRVYLCINRGTESMRRNQGTSFDNVFEVTEPCRRMTSRCQLCRANLNYRVAVFDT